MKKGKSRSKLETLTNEQIELITARAESRGDVPIVKSRQVNMRLSPETLSRARRMAEAQGKPLTTFLASLLKEDIERLWKVFV
jgi:predicted DNA binding CopG/RHH family protein